MGKEVIAYAHTGTYVGFEDANGIVNFLGIPYAQPPQRWKRAAPLPECHKVVEAKKFGPICWQPWQVENHPKDTPCSEDCLTLNIWTDDVNAKGKPVMLFIHGGSYHTGSNRMTYYCNDQFAADCRDIVFVNINYRIGAFGTINLSALDPSGEYDGSWNLHTYDQIEALKWVHRNIAAFGGDPENITVYGQSAGSYSTATLMLIPEVNHLFKKAICESSCYANNMSTLEYSVRIGQHFAELANAKSLQELLDLPPEEIVRIGDKIFFDPHFPKPFGVVKDGDIIPLNPYAELRSGVAKHITLMAGSVAGEFDTAAYGRPDEAILSRILSLFGDRVTPELLEKYLSNNPQRSYRTGLMDLRNDLAVRIPVLNALEAQSSTGATTYLYYLDHTPAGSKIRSQHLFEIPFFNNKINTPVDLDPTIDEPIQGKHPCVALVRQIQGCWANFARTGKPGGDHIGTDWPAYTLNHKVTMVLEQTTWTPILDFRQKDTALTQPLMNE